MKFLYYGLAALFLFMALRNLLHGDLANAGGGLLIGALLLGAAVGVPREARAIQAFQAWLLEHEAALRRGATIYYQDIPLTATTELTRFTGCFSIVLLTHSFTSRYLLRRSPRAAGVRAGYTLLTLLFGWWAIPFGPIRTVQALYRNLRGGHVQTVGEVLVARLAELAEEAEEAALDLAREQAAEREGRGLL